MSWAVYLLLLVAIGAAVYLAVRIPWRMYRRYRGTRVVTCPENHEPAAVAVDTDLAIAAQQGAPDGIDLDDGGRILGLTVGIQGLELVQTLVQSPQRYRAKVELLRLLAHLPQAQRHAAPALDLGIDVCAQALIGSQHVLEVDLHAAAAFTPHPR